MATKSVRPTRLMGLFMVGALMLALGLLMVGVTACGQEQVATESTPKTTVETTTGAAPATTAVPAGQEATTTTAAPGSGPVTQITLPPDIPGYTELDPATGLHVTGTPQTIDIAGWRLEVTGKVDREISLTYDEILALPKVTATPKLICPGYFEDVATWSGAPLHTILEMAGVQPDAQHLVLESADGYATTVGLDEALLPESFLAYELEGQTLPALHGFPLRAVFPEKYGSAWVKWLVAIEVR